MDFLLGSLAMNNVFLPVPRWYKQLSALRDAGPDTDSLQSIKTLDISCLPADVTRLVDQYSDPWWLSPASVPIPIEDTIELFYSQVCRWSSLLCKLMTCRLGNTRLMPPGIPKNACPRIFGSLNQFPLLPTRSWELSPCSSPAKTPGWTGLMNFGRQKGQPELDVSLQLGMHVLYRCTKIWTRGRRV